MNTGAAHSGWPFPIELRLTRARRLRILPGGQCLLLPETAASIDGLDDDEGEAIRGELGSEAWVTRWLCVVVMRVANGAGQRRLRLPILAAHQRADDYRRLRVLLRNSSGAMPGANG